MDNLEEKLKALLHHKKGKEYYCEKLNITKEHLEELLKEIRKSEKVIDEIEEYQRKVNTEKGTLESSIEVTFDPQSVEELAKLHKIDLTKYKISNYWSKLKSNGKFTSSVFASLKKPVDYTPEDFAKFLSTWNPKNVELPIKITSIG